MQRGSDDFNSIIAWLSALILTGAVFGIGAWVTKRSARITAQNDAQQLRDVEKTLKQYSLVNKSEPAKNEKADVHEVSHSESTLATLEQWGYEGNLAPWYWANLNDRFKLCAKQEGQSPIDISGASLNESLKPLKFYYKHGITRLTLHHSTVQGEIDRGSYLEWDGERFDLMKVYFRTPSEHRLNGLPWEMEVQLEHQSVTGSTIMVSTFIKLGQPQEFSGAIERALPQVKDEIKDLKQNNWLDLFPNKRTYWTYLGSQTIPPCEGLVRWVVFTEQTPMPKQLIDKFALLQKTNVRPVALLGRRELSRSNR